MKSPGTVLYEEFMQPAGLSQKALARDLFVSPGRINEIIKGRRKITIDTALRLARYFDMPPLFWMDLQTCYKLEQAEENGLIDEIHKQVRVPEKPLRRQRGHRRIDERILQTHLEIAEKVKVDPEGAIAFARQNIERWGWEKEEVQAPYMKAWLDLLDGPIPRLEQVQTGTGERSVLLRSSSPFVGLLRKKDAAQ